MKCHLALTGLVCCALVACATLGLEQPKSLPDRIAYATSTADGLVVSATNALNAHTLSSEDAAYVSKTAKDTSLLIDAAMTDPNPQTAAGRVQLVEGILRQLQTYLAAKGAKT